MHRVSISIVTLVAMWATIIFQCHTIHIINKRKVPDEPFDKDINVHSKNESQTSGVVWTEDAIKDEPKSYSTWASTDEPQIKGSKRLLKGKDEPQTDCKDCKYVWWNSEAKRYECSIEKCPYSQTERSE